MHRDCQRRLATFPASFGLGELVLVRVDERVDSAGVLRPAPIDKCTAGEQSGYDCLVSFASEMPRTIRRKVDDIRSGSRMKLEAGICSFVDIV